MSGQTATVKTRRRRGETDPAGRPGLFTTLAVLFLLVIPQLAALILPFMFGMAAPLGYELPNAVVFVTRMFQGAGQVIRILLSLCLIGAATGIYLNLGRSARRRRFAVALLLLALLYALFIGAVFAITYYDVRATYISAFGAAPF